MVQPLEIPLGQLLTFGYGCCLCFAGLLVLIRQFRQGLWLAVGLLALGLVTIESDLLLREVATLVIWPAFYLYTRQSLQIVRWYPLLALHFLVPIIWGAAHWLEIVSLERWLAAVAFLQLIPYILLSLVELYRQFRSRIFQQAVQPAYASWAFFGLLMIFALRLLLPLIPVDYQVLMSVFYGGTGMYLLGLFSFSIHGPFRRESWTLHLEKEGASNFEEELQRRLNVLLQQEKVFVIPDLTLQELSNKMHIKSAALSGFFSTSLGRNFNEVINEHRVEEVKRLMRDPNTDPKATLMELAYKAGFNSKATFNRIFKEMTGMTPKAFKTQLTE
ncbi:MAG: helix-turn-helix transcriptional regulator [Cytophagales bacterium]|nr:helix-turn-helix transcriptional regulator [Cytophagales bacterium]